MTPYRTRIAKQNLREGIKKMEKTMSPAARVRREFQLGRPPRPLPDGERLRPTVLWQKAVDALDGLRARMSKAELNPLHAEAAIVYIEQEDPTQPRFLELEVPGKTPEEVRAIALELLAREDIIELGMLFSQWDERMKQRTTFPYLFYGLNSKGMFILKLAAKLRLVAEEKLRLGAEEQIEKMN